MSSRFWPANVHALRGVSGCCHLLHDPERGEAVLMDGGMLGEGWALRRTLRRLGLQMTDIKAILLTHGHLDHVGYLAQWRRETEAEIWAHEVEKLHVAGAFPYTGLNRWCGRLEAAGRAVFGIEPAPVDRTFADGDILPWWGGLRVVHLPGHTHGHCGFFSEKTGVLFSGDLVASYLNWCHHPSAILNSCPELYPESVEKVTKLNPRGLVPNHYDWPDAALHRRRFDGWSEKFLRRERLRRAS
jgi:glyoxylase-like metal-dependent hydrolase (beta-lactamase superfamily II)